MERLGLARIGAARQNIFPILLAIFPKGYTIKGMVSRVEAGNMKNVVDARGEFPCCGHAVTTAAESHFYSRELAPRVLERLMERARQRCGYIEPCAGKNWEQCFMDHGKYGRFLYFNTADGGTHVEKEGA